MSKTIIIVVAFVICVFATGLVRGGALEMSDVAERVAIALVWVVGVAFMIWTVARNPTGKSN